MKRTRRVVWKRSARPEKASCRGGQKDGILCSSPEAKKGTRQRGRQRCPVQQTSGRKIKKMSSRKRQWGDNRNWELLCGWEGMGWENVDPGGHIQKNKGETERLHKHVGGSGGVKQNDKGACVRIQRKKGHPSGGWCQESEKWGKMEGGKELSGSGQI